MLQTSKTTECQQRLRHEWHDILSFKMLSACCCTNIKTLEPRWISLFLPFNSHFPGEAGLASFIGTKDDGSGGDNWSYKLCKAPVELSPPNQHATFYTPDILHVANEPRWITKNKFFIIRTTIHKSCSSCSIEIDASLQTVNSLKTLSIIIL